MSKLELQEDLVMEESAKLIIEVVAGLLPGRDPEPEFTRRWAITSKEWEEAIKEGSKAAELLAIRNGQAQGYAAWLMLQPSRLSWIRTDWVWL